MTLDDESVKTEVHGLLRDGLDEVATASDVRRVADDGQLGQTTTQLDGQMPLGDIAVDGFVGTRETAMNCSDATDASAIDTFDGANPKLDVRIDRILDQHGHILACQSIGKFLHSKGIGSGACSDPQHIDTKGKGGIDVSLGGHFNTNEQSSLSLKFLKPGQTNHTHALEASWLGARLPDACTEEFDALLGKRATCGQYLFFTFGATGAGNDERTLDVELRQQRRECHFHNV